MAIKHAAVKVSGEKGLASEWNDDHVVDDDSKPKNNTTLIVAASNSMDTTRADYVCDGVNDEAEINQAIADLPAGGGRISLLEGTFDQGAAINMNKDNVSLIGQGDCTVLTTSAAIDMITGTTTDGINISLIRINGNSTGVEGIHFDRCENVKIERCTIHHMTGYGIQMEAGGAPVVGEDNMVIGNIIHDCNNGIASEIGGRNLISSNIIKDCTSTGISLRNLVFGSNIVTNNMIRGCNLGIYATMSSTRLVISGNYIGESGATGITGGESANALHNSVITDNVVYDSANDGIAVNGDNNLIASNRVQDSTNDEIHIRAGNQNLIHGNILLGVHVNAINDGGVGTVSADNIVA